MQYDTYRFDGEKKFRMEDVPTNAKDGLDGKAAGKRLLAANQGKIDALQEALYAESKQSLLVIFQAMDAAGKDGTIRHVFSGINPQGVQVTNFKQPSKEALARDYLWRVHLAVPQRGIIGIFNRSHYEDVLISRVLDLPKAESLPARTLEDIWTNRYRQIRNFERMLYENGTTIIKIYLHLSKAEQTARFLSRTQEKDKQWKFSSGDLQTSSRWDDYMHAYEKAINETAAKEAPWYVVPADRKWYARAVVSEIVKDALEKMAPAYPSVDAQTQQAMQDYRQALGKET